jgi:hypothetical protein
MRRLILVAVLAAVASPAWGSPGQAPFREGRRGTDRTFLAPQPPPICLNSPGGTVYAVYDTGQSNALPRGVEISVAQPYSHQRLNGSSASLLVESGGESPLSGAAAQLTSIRAAENDWFWFTRAASGTELAGLDIGSTVFTQVLTQASNMLTVNPAARIVGFTLYQGENDAQLVTPRATWTSLARNLRADYERELRALGALESQGLTMLIQQTAGWTNYVVESELPLAQTDAARAEPTRISMVGAGYQYTYEDAVHLDASGQRWHGQMAGKVREAVQFAACTDPTWVWEDLHPRRIGASGSTVQMYFVVPCLRYVGGSRCAASPELVFDTTLVSARTNYGFEYLDPNVIGVAPTIAGLPTVAASCPECAADERRVDLPLTAEPRDGSEIRYAGIAQTGTAIGCVGHGLGAGCNAAGNLRDNDNTVAQAGGYNLANWAVTFRERISSGTVAPTGAPTIANATALDVSGTNYFDVADAAALDFTTAMSFVMIARFDTVATARFIASHSSAGFAFRFQSDTLSADELLLYLNSTSNFVRTSAANLTTGTTYCLAFTYNGSIGPRATIYAGPPGAVVAPTQSVSGSIPASLNNDTGVHRFGWTSANLDGPYDEIAYYGVELTLSQVQTICGAYTGVAAADLENLGSIPDPITWWRHDGDSGTTVVDHVAGSHPGTTRGSPTRVTAPGLP